MEILPSPLLLPLHSENSNLIKYLYEKKLSFKNKIHLIKVTVFYTIKQMHLKTIYSTDYFKTCDYCQDFSTPECKVDIIQLAGCLIRFMVL